MNQEDDFKEFKIRISTIGDIEISPVSGDYKYCLVFVHGLNHEPLSYVRQFLSEPLKSAIKHFKIVLPRAPMRKMTHHNMTAISWFDIKTYEQSFERPFDEAFSSEQIKESGELITAVVEREASLLGNDYSKIFIGGFSQGCGMSIHVAHTLPKDVAGVIAIAGYFFEITPLKENNPFPLLIIHGLSDKLRPWEQVQKSYTKYPGVDKITLVEGMGHELDTHQTRQHFADFIQLHAKL